MNNKPLIKLFKTREKFYFFDTNTNEVVNVNEHEYKELKIYMESKERGLEELDTVRRMRQKGYLSLMRVEEIVSEIDDILPYYLENNIEQVILQLTQQCNFRCEYCVYSGSYYNRTHSSKRMNIETAFKAIDFAIAHSKENSRLAINFYGGEPLLEFDLLKRCIEYAENKSEGKFVEFYMTTNGYFLSNEVVKFLSDHKVWVTISLDGPKEIHDEHRKLSLDNKSTFDKVFDNIKNVCDKFENYIPYISLNAVIDVKNSFYAIDDFFKNNDIVKKFHVKSSPISDINRKDDMEEAEGFYAERQYEVFKSLYYLVKNKENKNESKLLKDIYEEIWNLPNELDFRGSLKERMHPGGPCIAGAKRLFVSVDGNLYPCERCDESSEFFRIGNLDSGFDVEKVRKIINIGKLSEEACKNCWAINHCTVCAAHIDKSEGEFKVENKLKLCNGVKKSFENDLKTYCVLKEFGYDFKNTQEEEMYIYKNY